MYQLIVSGLFGLAFAGIYVYGTTEAIMIARACSAAGTSAANCQQNPNIESISYILTTIGNVISGGIVGILAVSARDELPAARIFGKDSAETAKNIAAYIPLMFIIVWVVCGVATVVFGLINNANLVPPLTSQAKGWLGSAATAVLAYLAPVPGSANGNHTRNLPPPSPPSNGGI